MSISLSRRRFLALGALGSLGYLTACAAPAPAAPTAVAKSGEAPPPTATAAPATPSQVQPTVAAAPSREPAAATATSTVAPPTPPPTPTPEPRFGAYDTFVGDVEGGGKVLIATVPGAGLLFFSFKNEPLCSNPAYRSFMFSTRGGYQGGSFAVQYANTKQIDGRLYSPEVLTGTMKGVQFEVPATPGPVSCPGGQFPFKAGKVGSGKAALLKGYRTAADPAASLAASSDEQVRANIERSCGCTLPEN